MAINVNINSQILTYADLGSFPAEGSLKTIYIAEDTDFSYYWDGTDYVQLSGGGGGGSQDLQDVTDNGATTTNSITVDSANYYSIIEPSDLGTENKNTGSYAYLGADGVLGLHNGSVESDIKNTDATISGITLQIPDKATGGNYTIQTTEEKGVAYGYASLDSGGKIPATQLPNSVMDFLGAWNANTNTPTLADGTGNAGDVYRCSVAGTINLGSGSQTFGVGDWVMYNGSIWQHSPATDAVTSVNTKTGAVTLNYSDVGALQQPTGTTLQYIDGTGGLQTFPTSLPSSYVQHAVKAGEALTKGQAVYVSSADGTNMIVSKASNTTEALSSKTMGLITTDLALNGQGYVLTEGLLTGTGGAPLNTNSANVGDPVWLGTNGNLIFGLANKPYAPSHLVYIGVVTRKSATVGEIFVRVQNGFELKEIHDVSAQSPANGDSIVYNSSTSLWEATTTKLEVLHAWDSTNSYDYMGVAKYGTATSASTWTITRIIVASNGTTTTGTATGAWDNRASLTYI